MSHDQDTLRPLVDRTLELAGDPAQEAKKRMWADHQALRPTPKIPVCVYYEGIPAEQWRCMFGDDFLQCVSPLGKSIEFDLRRSIWMAENVPDDHIVWPSLTVAAPAIEKSGWGVPIEWEHPDTSLGAKAYKAPFADGIDLNLLRVPQVEFDTKAVQETVEQASEVTSGLLTVFPHFRTPDHAPFDVGTSMRGMEALMTDIAIAPETVKRLMAFITDAEVAYNKRREKNGWLNVFPDPAAQYQQVGFRVHCAHLSGDFPRRSPSLADEWAYLSAQTSAGIGPREYEEFVFPYTAREAELFSGQTVYYHGCECLDEKMNSLAALPNLRRFHVSPWTSLEKARDRFQGKVVLEVHDHPGKVFFGLSAEEIRGGIRRLVEKAEGHPMDLNISDIHSFNGQPGLLVEWARIAQEEAERACAVCPTASSSTR